jgi:hypothetical protein
MRSFCARGTGWLHLSSRRRACGLAVMVPRPQERQADSRTRPLPAPPPVHPTVGWIPARHLATAVCPNNHVATGPRADLVCMVSNPLL